MRSIIVAVYELNADEVFVVGHHDCGMSYVDPSEAIKKMKEKGISTETIDTIEKAGINLQQWLYGFDSVEDSVKASVQTVKNHPLLPKNVPVHGLVNNPETEKFFGVYASSSEKTTAFFLKKAIVFSLAVLLILPWLQILIMPALSHWPARILHAGLLLRCLLKLRTNLHRLLHLLYGSLMSLQNKLNGLNRLTFFLGQLIQLGGVLLLLLQHLLIHVARLLRLLDQLLNNLRALACLL